MGTEQRGNVARIVLQEPRQSHATLLRKLHWLPVQQQIDYKVALLTFKVCSTSTHVPSMPDQEAGAHPQPTIRHHVAVSTIVKDNICEARFSLHSARNLELATKDSD